LDTIIFFVIGGVMLYILYKIWPRRDDSNNIADEIDDMSVRLVKGLDDFQSINLYLKQINDIELNMIGNNLQKKGERILLYLQKHRQCLPEARQFVEYYQDRTAALLRQCVTLEQTGIDSEEAKKVVEQTKEVLRDFSTAYDVQLAKIMDTQLIDMAAELSVARQVLENDGIEKGANTLPKYKEESKNETENSKTEKESTSWITPKAVGGAVLAVLGVVGIYKLLNNSQNGNKKKRKES